MGLPGRGRPAAGSHGGRNDPACRPVVDGGAFAWPPPGSIHQGVFPGGLSGEEDDITPADLRAYEQLAGKRAAWVYFSHNWGKGRAFPLAAAAWIRERGSVPYVRLMLPSRFEQNQPERTFTLDWILAGEFDADLRAWAREARGFGTPLLAEFGTEANGCWFPWNAWWNGKEQRKEYGDPATPDGPERFRDACRRIVRTMREEGAANVLWVFHVNNRDIPEAPWNRLEDYYPGDGCVDCLGVSAYGAQTPMDDEWPEFRPLLDAVVPRLAALAPGKPVLLLEFGATRGNPGGTRPPGPSGPSPRSSGGGWGPATTSWAGSPSRRGPVGGGGRRIA